MSPVFHETEDPAAARRHLQASSVIHHTRSRERWREAADALVGGVRGSRQDLRWNGESRINTHTHLGGPVPGTNWVVTGTFFTFGPVFFRSCYRTVPFPNQ